MWSHKKQTLEIQQPGPKHHPDFAAGSTSRTGLTFWRLLCLSCASLLLHNKQQPSLHLTNVGMLFAILIAKEHCIDSLVWLLPRPSGVGCIDFLRVCHCQRDSVCVVCVCLCVYHVYVYSEVGVCMCVCMCVCERESMREIVCMFVPQCVCHMCAEEGCTCV